MIVIAPDGFGGGGLPTELIAAFIGALVGGAISLGTTWYFNWDAERKNNRSLGLRILHKVQRIASAVQQAHFYVMEAKQRAGKGRLSGQLLPIVGFRTEPIDFEAEELAIFTLGGHADTAQSLLDTAAFHNLLMTTIAEYYVRRNAHDEEMSRVGLVFNQADGTRATTIDQQTMDRLAPNMAKLEDLAQHLLRLSEEGLPVVLGVVGSVPRALREALKDPRFPVELVHGDPSEKGKE